MKHRIYLDYNATSPLHPEVKKAMEPFWQETFGNPSSTHHFGHEARFAVDEARERAASLLNCEPSEIYFTSCGTESNNLALIGAGLKLKDRGRHIVANRMEHLAVLNPIEFLVKEFGFYATYVEPDPTGRISVESLRAAIQPDTVLVTMMAANNETGTIEPVEEAASFAAEKKIFFHCDAVQALGKIPVSVKRWTCDTLSFSGHKISGPKGIGALYVKKGTKLRPFLTGGHQERNVRPGTENVAGIAAFGKACELIEKNLEASRKDLLAMRERLEKRLLAIPDAHLNGHPTERLPNTVNVSFDGVQGEGLLIRLDIQGIAVSSGSACTSGSIEPSHVLQAMGLSESRARSAVRFSLGWDTRPKDMDIAAEAVEGIVSDLRSKKAL